MRLVIKYSIQLCLLTLVFNIVLRHSNYNNRIISIEGTFFWDTPVHFHGQKIFRKYHCLKVENFQLQNFFPTENLCRPMTFHKFFFPRKIFLSGNGLH